MKLFKLEVSTYELKERQEINHNKNNLDLSCNQYFFLTELQNECWMMFDSERISCIAAYNHWCQSQILNMFKKVFVRTTGSWILRL